MVDQLDHASDFQEKFLAHAIAYRKPEAKQLKACGACYSCGQESQGLFCDTYCEDDYKNEQSAKKRNGM